MEQKQAKKYTSIHEVAFDDVLKVLKHWKEGNLSRAEVFDFAETLFYLSDPYGFPEVHENDERYSLFVTLELLNHMYTNPVLKEDIPALETYLIEGRENPQEASKKLDAYWEAIDFESRLKTVFG